MDWYTTLSKIAQLINEFRLIPRILVFGYGYLLYQHVMWYQTIDNPTTAHSVALTALTGFGSVIFTFYAKTKTETVVERKTKSHKYSKDDAPSLNE